MEDLPLGRIAALVPEFAVKDLPLGRTLMIILLLLLLLILLLSLSLSLLFLILLFYFRMFFLITKSAIHFHL